MTIAGHDTTATTIGMAMYRLAKDPSIEKKVLEEIDAFG